MDIFLTFAIRQGAITHNSLKEISIIFLKYGSINDTFVSSIDSGVNKDFMEVWKGASQWFKKADTVYLFGSLGHKSNLKSTLVRFGLELLKKNWRSVNLYVKNRIGMDARKSKLSPIYELVANGNEVNVIDSQKLNKILS